MKQKLLQVGGAGATREAITKAQAIELKVICPPIAAQIKFAGIADWIEKMKAQEIAGLATLQNLTSSLQHQAFTTGFNA
jgi:restriction endonuclease S subunit